MSGNKVEEYPVIWFQAATCTGCSVSVLNTASPTVRNLLVDEVVPGKHLSLKFQPTVMAAAGEIAIEAMNSAASANEGGYLLVVEGSVPIKLNGIYGTVGAKDGREVPMMEWVTSLAADALAVVALGTCASYGGIFGARPNPTGCVGVSDLLAKAGISTPVVNVPGCPPHPDWFAGTVACALLGGLPSAEELDDDGRLLAFYGKLIHENCPRRAYFDEGKFAKKFGDEGCLHELGCKGPLTYADCPIRLWNGGQNWCIGSGGVCIGCTQPEFPDLFSPLYVKVSDVDLPVIGEYWLEKERSAQDE
jgi:hydrogenase small subunit